MTLKVYTKPLWTEPCVTLVNMEEKVRKKVCCGNQSIIILHPRQQQAVNASHERALVLKQFVTLKN